MRPWLRRTVHTLVPLALTVCVLAPLFGGPVGSAIAAGERRISVIQNWSMYAPDPQRSHTYIHVSAELADGTTVPLDEAIQAEEAWTTMWAWQKRRSDMWRYYVVQKPGGGNPNRLWYLRGLCVREERARGVAPVRIVAERVHRKFTPPDRVLAGAPGLGEPTRGFVQAIRCNDWPERAMIAFDRTRRGLPADDPRPKPRPRPPRAPRASE